MKASLYSNRRKYRDKINFHSFNSNAHQNNFMSQLKEFEYEKENIVVEPKWVSISYFRLTLNRRKVSTGISESIQSKYTKKRKKPGILAFDSNKTFDCKQTSNDYIYQFITLLIFYI